MKNKNKIAKARETIFQIYSQNLSWIKEHPQISFDQEFKEGYICPLCFDLFKRDDLLESSPNPLTYEHNPPKSLGGTGAVLTCKKCNSVAGERLDSQLLKRMNQLDFLEQTPNAKSRAVLDNGGNRVASILVYDDRGVLNIYVDRKNSHPQQANNFFTDGEYTLYNHMFNFGDSPLQDEFKLNFSTDFGLRSDERLAEIALLKIAYLTAFEKFGNGFIINPLLAPVREQILNPEKTILKGVFGLNYDFPDYMVGLNIINKPSALFCFLSVFILQTPLRKRQFAIALPGFGTPGLAIYDNIEKILCVEKEGSTQLNLEHLWNKPYVREKNASFISLFFWQKMTKRFDNSIVKDNSND